MRASGCFARMERMRLEPCRSPLGSPALRNNFIVASLPALSLWHRSGDRCSRSPVWRPVPREELPLRGGWCDRGSARYGGHAGTAPGKVGHLRDTTVAERAKDFEYLAPRRERAPVLAL